MTQTALSRKAGKEAGAEKNMLQWVNSMQPQIAKALPSVITPERFTRMVMTAVSTNPTLGECTPSSFCGAMMQAAQLGLEPNTPLGQAYLIPFRSKGVQECQFQLGFKGLIELAHRSGEFKMIYAKEVYESDVFSYQFGLEPKLDHVPYQASDGARGEVTHYYAVYNLVNGGYGFEVMSKAEMDAHREKYSQSARSSYSPWSTSYDEMAKKTVLKKVLKYAPIKTDFVREVSTDETIKSFSETSENMMDLPSEQVYEVEPEVVKEEPQKGES